MELVICKEELLSCEEEEESFSGGEEEEEWLCGDEEEESFSGGKEELLSCEEEEESFSGGEEEEDSFSGGEEEEESFSGGEEEEESFSGGKEEESLSGDEEEEKSFSGDGEEEEEEEVEEENICRLSHPGEPHTLSRQAGQEPPGGCFAGGNNKLTYPYHPQNPLIFSLLDLHEKTEGFHHHCTTCDVEFHEGCHSLPRKMTHPYHPQHPLIFSVLNKETGIIYDSNYHDYTDDTEFIGVGIPDHGNIFDNCTWCGENLKGGDLSFYRCSICNFCLCAPCSLKYPLPTITNPKNHHHSLIFLPRPLLVPCDACGLVKKSKPIYACFQCNYMVHRGCIDLPRVIKITRHPHRLFYTPFLSPTISSPCRLCYQTVDIKYGQYLCNHDDCSYVVHSKCATHKKVWDGRELGWEPEEFGEAEDVASFKKVGDGLIQYFSHEHHLKLEMYNSTRDADKQCQACVLHIDSHDYYNCVQCDFFLHEVCANLPRKLDHALHHHSLFLETAPQNDYYAIACSVCARAFSGFKYTCSEKICERFRVDVGCILVPDCFSHKSHEHPLFIPISAKWILCDGCNRPRLDHYLQCTLCKFAICYECATIPDKLHNKYDALPLSLCYGELADETYWCEVCEGELDPSEWFYTCTKSYITIHKFCALGLYCYMKTGYTLYLLSSSVKVLCNNSNTRPICYTCSRRCSSSVYFKFSNGRVFCCFNCFSF